MTDYTDLKARLRAGTGGGKHWMDLHEEAAAAIEALLAAMDSKGVLEFFEQSRRDAAAVAALTAERDALRDALREAGKAIGDFGDDLTYVEGERDLHSRAYEIMRGIRAALTAKP